MISGHEREFAVVEQLIRDKAPTAGVDALTLAIVKTERQMRRLMTHAVFQSAAFESEHVGSLRQALVERRHINFQEMRQGFEMLSGTAIAEALGDQRNAYEVGIKRVRRYRNKLFHGQLTEDSLSFSELTRLARHLSKWCRSIGETCEARFGYQGFDRSYVKGQNRQLIERATELVPNLAAYRKLLKNLEEADGEYAGHRH